MRNFRFLMLLLLSVVITTNVWSQGSTCDDPIIVDLPVVDYFGTTEGFGDDYSVSPCSNSYMGGDDIVFQFTLTETMWLSGSVTGSWTGLHILDAAPDAAGVACIALGSGSNGGLFNNVTVGAGTYFAIISTYPSPQFTTFTLNLSATMPPAAPYNFVAEALSSQVGVELNWTGLIFTDEGYTATYNVYRGATLIASAITENSYTDLDVTSGTEYCYIVTQIKPDASETPASEQACATPQGVVLPNPVTYLAPLNAAQNVSITPTFTWTAEASATGYYLYVGTSDAPVFPTDYNDMGNITTYTISVAAPLIYSTGYFWQVIPYNVAGNAENCPIFSFGTVPDPTLTAPFLVDFEAGKPAGWTGTMGVSTTTPHGVNGSKGLYKNLWSSTTTCDVITAPINGITDNMNLTFFYRLVNYTNYPSTALTLAEGDGNMYEVLVSTNGGVDFTSIYTINYANHVTSTDFAKVTIPMGAYAGQTIKVKILGTWGTGDYHFDVDNIAVQELAEEPIFAITPSDNFDFGSIYVNTTDAQTFTISNNGVGELVVTEVSLDGSDVFTLTDANTYPATVTGGTLTFAVNFMPLVADTYATTLNVTASGTVYTVAITGTATNPLPGATCGSAIDALDGENACAGAPFWYKYTPTENVYLTFSSCMEGQAVDTKIFVYEGDCSALTQIAVNDDLGWNVCTYYNYASAVTIVALAGETYKFFWSSQYTTDPFNFTVTTEPLPTTPVITIAENTEIGVALAWEGVPVPPSIGKYNLGTKATKGLKDFPGATNLKDDCVDQMVPAGIPEVEPNGGINSDPIEYDPRVVGTMENPTLITGTYWVIGGASWSRDTDWFNFTLTEPMTIYASVEVTCNDPMLLIVNEAGTSVLAAGNLNGYGLGESVQATLAPGNYWLWVGSQTTTTSTSDGTEYIYNVSFFGVPSYYANYNIYRNNELLVSNIYENIYLDETVVAGNEYCYTITENFENGNESAPSEAACVDVPAGGVFAITPSEMFDFGQVYTSFEASQTFTVTNEAFDALSITEVALTGDDVFTLVDNNTYPVQLTTGQLQFNVVFAPVAEAQYSTSLSVVADGVTYYVAIIGAGLEAEPEELWPPSNLMGTAVYPNNVELEWDAAANPYLLSYDDGTAENAWAVSGETLGMEHMAQKYTYSASDFNLDQISFYIQADVLEPIVAQNIKFSVFGDDGGIPNEADVLGEYVVSFEPAALNEYVWVTIDTDIPMTAGQVFYLDAFWDVQNGTGVAPDYDVYFRVGGDANAPDGFVYWTVDNGATWNNYAATDLMMHAQISVGDKSITLQKGNVQISKGTTPYVANADVNMANYEYSLKNVKGFMEAQEAAPKYTIPASKALIGYNIYRDGVKINTQPVVETNYTDLDLNDGTYTYNVTAVYHYGESVPSNSIEVPVELITYDFDFEDGVMPEGWIVINNDGDAKAWSVTAYANAHSGGYTASVSYNASGNDDWLITAPLMPEADDYMFSLWARSTSTTYLEDFVIKVSTTGTAMEDFVTEVGGASQIPNEWGHYEFDLSAFNGQQIYVAIVCVSVDELTFRIDDITGPFIYPDNDLAAKAITGATAPTQGIPADYYVTVKNGGELVQTDYQVQLVSAIDETVLETVAGVEIESGDQMDFMITHTFATPGETAVYGKVVLANDENLNNNATAPLTVNVLAAGMASVTVGDGALAYKLPINVYWKNSLSQTIYFADEMQIGGLLMNISYDYNFLGDVPADQPVKIWVANTDLTDLSGGMIPADQMELVFDGTYTFATGAATMMIELDVPFAYGGGNLAVMVWHPMQPNYYNTANNFMCTETGVANRTVDAYSDSQEFDPYNPPAIGSKTVGLTNKIANTTFYFNTAGLGALEGYVYGENNTPISGARVNVYGTPFGTYSNAEGHYSMPYVPEGTQTLVAMAHGYYDATVTDVAIVENELTVQDITMAQLPMVTVSGTVTLSDTQGPAEGVEIELTGYDDYSATTNAAGYYEITGVYANQTYTLSASYPGYANYTAEVAVGEVDLTWNFIITEIPIPASGVVAVENNDNIDLTWVAPGEAVTTEFRYDDGVVTGQLGFGANPNAVLGGAHFYNAVINEVTWLLTSNSAHPSAVIYIFGLDETGFPDVNQLLHQSAELTNVDDQWNTYVLPEPVEAPNGFHVGVCTPGIFTAIGTDDGVGTPYEFVLGTQYGIADWTAGTNQWLDVGPAGFPNNFTIRAYGMNYGPVAYKGQKPVVVANDVFTTGSAIESFAPKAPFYATSAAPKSFENYTVYRLLQGEEAIPANWTQLADNLDVTEFTDNTWAGLPLGVYKYAVVANYSNNVVSPAAFSNVVYKDMFADVTVSVTTNAGDAATGAVVTLTNVDGDPEHVYTGTVASGSAIINVVWKGTYNMTIGLAGFETYEAANIAIMDNTVALSAQLIEIIVAPYALATETIPGGTRFLWNTGFDGTVLVVDHDYSNSVDFTDDWTYVQPALDAAGIDYEYFEVTTNGPTAAQMAEYAAVIWLTGEGWHAGQTVSAADEASLSTYLDAGGALFLSSQDWFYDMYDPSGGNVTFAANSFPKVYLGLNSIAQDSWWSSGGEIIAHEGGAGSCAEGMSFTCTDIYTTAAKEGLSGDMITSHNGTTMLNVTSSPAGVTAVQFEKTVFWAGALASVDGVDVMAELITNVLDYLATAKSTSKAFQGFTVYLDGASQATGVMETQYDFTGLTPGQTYTAGVKSVYSSGSSQMVTIQFVYEEGQDDNANLATLTYNGTSVPGFNPNVTTYNVILPYGTTTAPTVAATTQSAVATLAITQATAVPGAATVVVTAEDGTTKTYTVNFNDEENDDATLSAITFQGVPVPGFNPNVYEYDVELPQGTPVPQISAITNDPNATFVVNNATQVPGTTTIVVTAEDGTTTQTYSINFSYSDIPMFYVPFTFVDHTGLLEGVNIKGTFTEWNEVPMTQDGENWTVTLPVVPGDHQWGCTDQDGTWLMPAGANRMFTVSETGEVTGQTTFDYYGAIGGIDFSAMVAYPNPVVDVLYINNVSGVERIIVSNILGQNVVEITVATDNVEIDLTKVQNGIYMVTLVAKDGQTHSEKIIKK